MNNDIGFFSPKIINAIVGFFYKLVILQVLLFIFNLPLMFSLFIVPLNQDSILFFILLMLTVFPSLVSLFHLLWNYPEKPHIGQIFKQYWSYYKKDFLKNMAYSFVFTLILEIATFDFFYVKYIYPYLWVDILFLVVLFLYGIFFNLAAMLHARYELKPKVVLLNTIYLTFSYFFRIFFTIVFVYAIFLFTKVTNAPVFQATSASVTAWFTFSQLKIVLEKELALKGPVEKNI